MFFSAGFCIFQRVTCGGELIFHILSSKSNFVHMRKKKSLSEKHLLKYHNTAQFYVCRELYQ